MSATSPMPEKRRSTRRRSAPSVARAAAALVPPAAVDTARAEAQPVLDETVRGAMDALAAVDLLLGMNFSLRVADEGGRGRR